MDKLAKCMACGSDDLEEVFIPIDLMLECRECKAQHYNPDGNKWLCSPNDAGR